MKPGARRRRSLLALLTLTALVFAGTLALAFLVRPERVVRLSAQATVAANGSAQLSEVIDYRFAGLAKHGIYRDVPGLAADAPGITATDNGRPVQLLVTSSELVLPSAHIRIGDPNRTISGDHTYGLSYSLPTLIDVNGDLDWNGVGTGWGVVIDQADLEVAGPWTWTSPRCQRGASGSTTPCTVTQPRPGLLVVHVTHLDTHEGVTVQAGRGAALATAPGLQAPTPVQWPAPGTPPWLTALVAAVAVLVAGLALRAVVERLGRDEVVGAGATDVAFAEASSGASRRISPHELAGMASIEFAPPKELTSWQGGLLAAEQVLDAHKVAWLLEAAIAGHLSLDEHDGTITLTRLEALPPPPPGAPPIQPVPPIPPGASSGSSASGGIESLLEVGFAGRPTITLGSYDKSFAAMWTGLGHELTTWMAASPLWEQRGRTRQRAARILGGLATVVGLVAIAAATFGVATQGNAFLPVVGLAGVVAGLGLAAVTAAFELMVRTPPGSGLWIRVESFRRFLHDSEGPQAEEAAKRGVLRQYTAWAIALDEVHHWSKAVEAAGADIGNVDRGGLGYVAMAPLLMNSTRTASVAPHASGGVGGGVGGGFGGGGGGSW